MNAFTSRTLLLSLILAVCFVPLYAHHGTQFLNKALEMNAAEVRLGEMAINKAQNARVKEFAHKLVNDHTEALNKVKELLSARNQNASADVKFTQEHQQSHDRLSKLSGAEFDRAFIELMVRSHQNGIRLFETQAHVHGNNLSTSKRTDVDSPQSAQREKPGRTDDRKYSRADLRRDVDTAVFANNTLPTLRHHLEMAQSIMKDMQNR